VGEKHGVWVVGGRMSMEQWWNDTDRGKLKYWEKNLLLTNPTWTIRIASALHNQ